jgi:hypothetical protein
MGGGKFVKKIAFQNFLVKFEMNTKRTLTMH